MLFSKEKQCAASNWYVLLVLTMIRSNCIAYFKMSKVVVSGRSIPLRTISSISISRKVAQQMRLMSSLRVSHLPSHTLNRPFSTLRPSLKPTKIVTIRSFSTGKTEKNEQNAEASSTNLPLKAVSALIVSAAALFVYFNYTKRQMAAAPNPATQSVGAPLVGGPFALVDHDGNTVTQDFLLGKYSIIYFGYTFCPDVCPEELEKITRVVDTLGEFL